MTTSFETLRCTTDPRGIQTIILARPEVHNAMNKTMVQELLAVAKELKANRDIRAVILSAEGKSFCAGGDLQWMQANMQLERQQRIDESRELGDMLRALNTLPQLLIGRINGQAFGGGIGLISVCDIAIGVTACRFALTEVKLGLAPANIAPFVMQRIGRRNCRRCMLNARLFDADFAHHIGLLDAVVAAEQLDQAVEEEIDRLLLCAPGAVAATKELINFVASENEEAVSRYTAESLADRWQTEECQHGVACFFTRKKANWI